ncbi:ankyrin repeat domain-containing protein [Chitinophaga sp.]|uniref:ankyrin repeat domain-containing protein n=1 Tax=Chitinophaga sp. TaxID=1869181 RepID=UPI0031D7656D
MAKKRVTLPKEFEDLLKKGNLQELKDVFTKCELDARGGYNKQTALAFDHCPHELAVWLVEQGADLTVTDTWGNTPLHRRSRSIFGNISSLLELGADVNMATNYGGTPLHAAAEAHNPGNTALLLAHGAKADIVNTRGLTPLELALQTCSNIEIVKTLAIAKLYLDAGMPVTPRMKESVMEVGKRFEFHRANFNKDSVREVSNALEELYRLFGAEPVAKRLMHDGESPIVCKTTSWQDQHNELWALLVPSSGPAATVQGEVIRISGKISRELLGNGGINWDDDFKKMADAFFTFVQAGNALLPAELEETATIVKEVKRKAGDTDRMLELAVKWVVANPAPIKLSRVEYKR